MTTDDDFGKLLAMLSRVIGTVLDAFTDHPELRERLTGAQLVALYVWTKDELMADYARTGDTDDEARILLDVTQLMDTAASQETP